MKTVNPLVKSSRTQAAKAILEAYAKSYQQQFDFGTSKLTRPPVTPRKFMAGYSLFFQSLV